MGIESSRNLKDYGRHEKLRKALICESKRCVSLSLGKAHLYNDPNKDETFVSALSACALPPQLETPYPIPGSTNTLPFPCIEGLVVFFGRIEELLLLATDDEKLLVLGLEQAYTDWEVSREGQSAKRCLNTLPEAVLTLT